MIESSLWKNYKNGQTCHGFELCESTFLWNGNNPIGWLKFSIHAYTKQKTISFESNTINCLTSKNSTRQSLTWDLMKLMTLSSLCSLFFEIIYLFSFSFSFFFKKKIVNKKLRNRWEMQEAVTQNGFTGHYKWKVDDKILKLIGILFFWK